MHQFVNKNFDSIKMHSTTVKIILNMFIEVLIICLYPVRVIRDTNANTYSLAFSFVPVTRFNFWESVRSV